MKGAQALCGLGVCGQACDCVHGGDRKSVCVCVCVHTCTCKCVDWQDETCLEGVENPSHPEGAEQLPISGTSLVV